MSRNVNTSTLSKDAILSKVSQISIFAKYFDISPQIIQRCIDTGNLICSPIRVDVHPTCGFKYDNKGRLKFKDFSGYFWGDCFDAAALVISKIYNERNINISNKEDFIFVLKHIKQTFSNIFYNKETDPYLNDDNIKNALNVIRNQKQHIELVVREWNEADYAYWLQFGINLQYLNTHFVYPVDQFYINRTINPEPKYYYNTKDACYAYILGMEKGSYPDIKLYFPLRPHGSTRFITNCNHLEGIYNLYREDYDYIIITKSTKDRLSIECTLESLNLNYEHMPSFIGVINIPHETYKLREFEYNWLSSKLRVDGKIISLMDNDKTGLKEANFLRKTYNILPLIIPKELNAKDFAELRSKYSLEEITNFIKTALNYVRTKCIRDTRYSDTEPF